MKISKFLTLTLLIASSSILGCPKTDPTPSLSQKDKIEKMKGLLKEIKTLRREITGQHVPVTFKIEEIPIPDSTGSRSPVYLFVKKNIVRCVIYLI